jgi:hypothetical protein
MRSIVDASDPSTIALRTLRRRCGSSLSQSETGASRDAIHRITAGGVWIDDASREIEDRVLQAEPSHWHLCASAVHVSRLYVPAESCSGQGGTVFTSFLPGVSDDALKRMRQTVRGWKLHRQTSMKLADLAPGAAMQLHVTWVVELLWGVLSDGNAQALSVYR